MKNKPKDIPYYGVRKSVINEAKPKINSDVLDQLVLYIKQRYRIHIRKDVDKKPAPWTTNRILREHRFTNVRREHDKETIWVIKNITSNPDLTYNDKLMNCLLFRLFNKHETAELIGIPIKFSQGYEPEDYREIFEKKRQDDPEYRFFTGAFYTSGLKKHAKRYSPAGTQDNCMKIMYFVDYILRQGFIIDQEWTTPDKVIESITRVNGIGYFLAYQIFIDFTYMDDFPFSENEFTIAGIGCKRGIDALFDDKDGMTYEECLFWLRDNWDDLMDSHYYIWSYDIFSDLPEYDRRMNLMSLENCMCELSKYEKIRHGTGRTKSRYNGG